MTVNIFFCYAYEDKELLQGLMKQLKPWKRLGYITMSCDSPIPAERDEGQGFIDNAHIIVLLISPDFIDSDYCYNQMISAMNRHARSEACVIPIILRPIYWQGMPFGKLQALPENGKPVTTWRNRELALYEVALGLRRTLRSGCHNRHLFSARDLATLAILPLPAIPRRTVLAALGGLSAVGGAGGGVVWLRSRQGQHTGKSTPVPQPSSSLGKLLYTYRKHKDIVSSISWSPDGAYIVSGSYDKTAQVWEPTKGFTHQTYRGHMDKVNAVAWSPKGIYIASASSDKTAHVWSAATGKTAAVYKRHNDVVTALTWSPDGTRIASASHDGTVQIWDAFTGRHFLTYPMNAPSLSFYPITAVAWSPDGTRIASGNANNSFDIWIASTGGIVSSSQTSGLPILAWSPNGKMIAIGGQHISVNVNGTDGSPIYNYRDTVSASVLSVAWSPDGQYIVFGGSDSIVRLWNPLITSLDNTAFIYKYDGHSGEVRGVAWSPDSLYIASCGQDKTVQVWQSR